MNEDDTYNALRRIPHEQMRLIVVAINGDWRNCTHSKRRIRIREAFVRSGWSSEEYKAELARKYYPGYAGNTTVNTR